jgi:hypothetical protein
VPEEIRNGVETKAVDAVVEQKWRMPSIASRTSGLP